MWRWLVIIARDRSELWPTWSRLDTHTGRMEIHFDRRCGRRWAGPGECPNRRAQPTPETDLVRRGFLVIPHPDLAATPR